MNILRSVAVVLLACTAALGEPRPNREASALIEQLPRRDQLLADVALFRRPGAATRDSAEVEQAGARLKAAKAGFARLRALLKEGASVFDYPGLIALSRVHHSAPGDTYSIDVGIPPGWSWDAPQGENPDEIRIKFDGRGVIIEVKAVLYRH